MKRFKIIELLCFSLFLLFVLSCGDYELLFNFDENGECYDSSARSLSTEKFESLVLNNGWKHVSTHEITADGKWQKENFYEVMDGGSPHHLFFESMTTVKVFSRIIMPDAPRLSHRYAYDYLEERNKIILKSENERDLYMQILSVDDKTLRLLECMGVNADGTKFYTYVVYRKMTAEELEEFQTNYTE
ncbi:hypothetical protein [Bacteroides muris (ex Afrizal et al. 2022)]|uniref:Lipoprotein n=1 Tax=Bacteroides muris (ex Afrizal et al. 2022) TaxID=2516960 RepID=A0A4S2AZD9_9BACE|nr:hypothetical protein [Bacteroides muris (ex Afrizal et al. 2022)]TGY07009.1 hypothetical protein E5355_07530 [Bacteroides muris (ex Afrizal et al. 2022)]